VTIIDQKIFHALAILFLVVRIYCIEIAFLSERILTMGLAIHLASLARWSVAVRPGTSRADVSRADMTLDILMRV